MKALALLALSLGAFGRDDLPSPQSFFGFPIGEDRKLATYVKTVEYLNALQSRSPWLRVETLGKTTLGLPQVMAVISTPENLAAADKWKDSARRLLDPRVTTPEQARAIAAEAPVVVMITCGIHSDEVAGPQTAVELAHDLTADRDLPFDRARLFDKLVLLLVPSVNPDGQEIVAEWVARTAGTDDEGAPLPRLYHHYAGHDNNRDWFAFNLKETNNISQVLYRTWRPQVLVDHHQMGPRGARFFVPPFGDPLNRNVHPLVWRGVNLIGQAIAFDLESQGKTGVAHDTYFQGWWQGGLSRAPWWHHGIGILTESASSTLAAPLAVDPVELETAPTLPEILDPLAKHPSPWRGGTWRMRDVCDYQRAATFATLRIASERRSEILRNVYTMASDAVERGRRGDPFAFVFPAAQRDPAARDRLLERLELAGVETVAATHPLAIGDRTYEAGSVIVPLAQPFGPYVRDLLEDQRYPDGPTSQRPYDVTGWTLWRMMGVACDRIDRPFAIPAADAGAAAGSPRARSRFVGARDPERWLAIAPGSNDVFPAVARALREPAEVRRCGAPVEREGAPPAEAGAFLVKAGAVPADGGWLTAGLSIDAAPLRGEPPSPSWKVRMPRIGVYAAVDPSMDEGWTRYVLDRVTLPLQRIGNADVQKELKLFDAIVIPESSPETLWDGGPRSETKLGRVPFPKEMRGGIGAEGVKSLRAFVEAGGTLVALGGACDFVIDKMELPVTNALKGAKREEFACPGSLVRIEVDPTHPIGFGMPREAAAFLSSSVALRTQSPNARFGRANVARFPSDGELLLSGYLKGGERLAGLGAAVELTVGKGRIVLIGIRAQHRAQTDGTFKLLLNALMSAAWEKG